MKPLSEYTKKPATTAVASESESSPYCAAYGCPLPGGISDSIAGGHQRWYCRFHFGEGVSKNDAITLKIKSLIENKIISSKGIPFDKWVSNPYMDDIRAHRKKQPEPVRKEAA
jgi:hypothetical protein